MCVEVVQGCEFDAASQADELLVLTCGTCSPHAPRANWGATRSFRSFVFLGPSGAIVLLVDQIVFVLAKHDIALFTFGNSLFY